MKTWLKNNPLVVYSAVWIVYFAAFFSRALTRDAAGNVVAGHVNIWGDWAIHFTMGSAMACRSLFLDYSPLLIGAPFQYPFFANMLSAVLIRMGVPFLSAFTIPSCLFSCAIVIGGLCLYKALFKSNRAAILGSMIFLLNGGWTFLLFASQVIHSSKKWETFSNPSRELGASPDMHIAWVSIIDTMMIPQRAFTHGFPLALFALALVAAVLMNNPAAKGAKARWRLGAVLIGLLPMIHTHSFLAGLIVLLFWLVSESLFRTEAFESGRLLKWLDFGLVVFLVSFPLVFFLLSQGEGVHQGLQWKPGWYAAATRQNWLWFWWNYWGLTPYMSVFGLTLLIRQQTDRLEKNRIAILFAPFFLFFVIINLFQIHAWIWDNTKLLVWASVGISGLAGYAVHRIMEKKRWLGMGLLVLMTLSGLIDAARIQRVKPNSNQMYSADDMSVVEWVTKNTSPTSIWLTGNNHNHWLFGLTGRQPLMAYPGWLWTHGYDYRTIEKDVKAMYQNPSDSSLFEKYRIDYIVVGPTEVVDLGAKVEDFEPLFPLVHSSKHIAVFSRMDRSAEISPSAITGKVLTLTKSLPTAQRTPGLKQTVFEGKDLQGKIIDQQDTAPVFNFWYDSGVPHPFPDVCSMIWQGVIDVPREEIITFILQSDDGSRLYIDDVLVIDNDGEHMVRDVRRNVHLSKGGHRIKLTYFNAGGGAIMKLRWAYPGQSEQDVPAKVLFH